MLRCRDGSLYCGVTPRLGMRLRAHRMGVGSKYVRSRSPFTLVGWSEPMTKRRALQLEATIKRLPAGRKVGMLECNRGNEDWSRADAF